MKTRNSLVLFFIPLCFFFLNQLQAAGGPDAYGYTWLDNNDAGGPAVNFIDIRTIGTQITGLTDDNSVGPFNMGFTFHYYWGDYNSVKVGSNGWLGLDNISNIASCFPSIPTAGGVGDNFIAPMLSDLIFSGAGNPATAYYWSNNTDTFIVAFHDVPYWQAAAPGYYNSSTFEVIFSGVDSSVTIQYGILPSSFNSGCVINIVGGIESPSGQYGLQHYSNTIPSSNSAFRFIYPDSVLINVLDAQAAWNLNTASGAEFFPQGSVNLTANVANSGNTNLTQSTTVRGRILNIGSGQVYTNTQTVATLNQGANSNITFTPPPTLNAAGQYFFETLVTNSQDINSQNDTLVTEIQIVDLNSPTATLSYVENATNEGGLGWSGGDSADGVGIYMEPPIYPITISSTEFYLSAVATGGSFGAVIYDDNGPNGGPGTVLDSQVVVTPTAGSWYTATPSGTVTINSGGFYIAWFMTGGTGMNIGTRLNEPISRRTYEILGNSWAGYRASTTTDFMIRANITGYPCNHTATFSTNQVGMVAQFANTSTNTTGSVWDFGDGNTSTSQNPIHVYSTPGVYTVCLISSSPCGADTICDTLTACDAVTAAFTDSIVGLEAYFTDASTQATSYVWDFGDGNTSTQQNPSHVYQQAGYYTICMIASNICSADTTCIDSVLFCAPPDADFSFVSDSTGLATFTNLSSGFGNISYSWDFGDASGTSTDQNPTYTYGSDGNYNVCLIITDDCGSDTVCNAVSITLVGLEESLQLAGLTVSPNPSNGRYRIAGDLSGSTHIRVFDPVGKLLLSEELATDGILDLKNVVPGVYLLEVISEGRRGFRKLIKE